MPRRAAAAGRGGRQRLEGELLAVVIDADAAVVGDAAFEQLGGQRVLNPLLDHALERPSAEGRVVAFAGDRLLRGVGDFQADVALGEQLREAGDLQVDDLANLRRDRADGRRSSRRCDSGTRAGTASCRMSHHGRVAFLRRCRLRSVICWIIWLPMFAGHHDDRVREIDGVAVAVGQAAVVEHLQQDVEHVAVGFFDFVEQHDGSRGGGGRLR